MSKCKVCKFGTVKGVVQPCATCGNEYAHYVRKRRKYSHEDAQLERLCGYKVKIFFFDGDIRVGILAHSRWLKGRYEIDGIVFRKTHVKRVTLLDGLHKE